MSKVTNEKIYVIYFLFVYYLIYTETPIKIIYNTGIELQCRVMLKTIVICWFILQYYSHRLPISCNGLIPGDYTAAMNSQESFVYPFYNGMRMPMIDPFLYPFMFPNKNMAVDSFTPSFTNNESNPESGL